MNQSLRERFNISRWAINYSKLTLYFWASVAVAGIFAFTSLKYALFPDISFPVVVINAQSPIKNAPATETALTKPLETPLKGLPGLRDVYSLTYPGRSIVNVFFDIGTNLETATNGVRKSLDKLPLPPDSSYDVVAVDLNESAVVSYALLSDGKSLEQLSAIATEKMIPRLQSLPGVLKVNLLGQEDVNTGNDKSLTASHPTLVRFNGKPALAFQVIKKGTANILDVVNDVEKAVGEIKSVNPDVEILLAETQAQYIKDATQATIDDLILAIILSVLVIFPFLRRLKATFIAALAIPLSLLGTCIVMALLGYNLETITLLALALVIGIVVDDAIVDVENISRLIDAGETPRQAAIKGTNEIGLAVTASTVTIVAVFLPVAFMGGAVGKFFQPFGLTVSAAVIFSLLVARTLSPILAIRWIKPKPDKSESHKLDIITGGYRRLLGWSLHHQKLVIAIALLSFVAGIALIPLIPKGFIPKLDRGEFNVIYTSALPKITSTQPAGPDGVNPQGGAFDWIDNIAKSPEGFLLRRVNRVGGRLEEVILKNPSVESVFSIAGLRGEPTRGKMYVRLKDDRSYHTSMVQEQIREALPPIKGVTVSVEDIPFVQTEADKPLQLAIRGDDIKTLREGAEKLKGEVRSISGIKDLELSGKVAENGDILQLERLNSQSAIFLSANLSGGLGLEDAAAAVENLAKTNLPPQINIQRWGSSAQSNDVLSSFGRTLAFATTLMLLVLLLLFGRLLEPIVIGLCLPLSIAGAMLGLLITGSDFSVISLIGLIFLLGLLNKNAVLLLDYTNQLRSQGWNREDAVIETGVVRLRPILMTTASTILGMVPIALGLGTGAELRQPMAVTIVGGLITSSVLSLIVVPVLYITLEDLWNKIFNNKSV
ncbi:MAG: Multidrug resistance protein MdtC [Chroococcopsis gigantea SAG 12.99]|jgi:multidrug efflux pump subunit AcrB|nr:efflux RND transporter permease subunit [Chlorogloea purpurea SAG 13.99]MDV2999461.1 Multidrug resistance protein MdtC [Chroococcopsis gigantea SAG 12.99]